MTFCFKLAHDIETKSVIVVWKNGLNKSTTSYLTDFPGDG